MTQGPEHADAGGQARAAFTALGAERFASLTTFRKNGQGVASPVWVARDGDALIVTTPGESYKVKRLRNDPRVQLVPCSRSGKVRDHAEAVSGIAAIVTGAASTQRLTEVIQRKYGIEYRVIMTLERLFSRRQKPRVILRITPSPG